MVVGLRSQSAGGTAQRQARNGDQRAGSELWPLYMYSALDGEGTGRRPLGLPTCSCWGGHEPQAAANL